MHSHAYKSHVGFENDRCVVVGVGNSAVDVAVELSRTSKQVAKLKILNFHQNFQGIPGHTSRYLGATSSRWLRSTAWHCVVVETRSDGQKSSAAESVGEVRLFRLEINWQHFALDITNILKFSIWLMCFSYAQNKCNKRFDHRLYGLQPRHGLLSAHPTVNDELPNRIASGTVVVKPNIDCFTGPKSLRFADGTEVDDIDTVCLSTVKFCINLEILGYSLHWFLVRLSIARGRQVDPGNRKRRPTLQEHVPTGVGPSHSCRARPHPTTRQYYANQWNAGILYFDYTVTHPAPQARLFMHVLMGHASLPCRELMALDIDDDITAQQCRYLESRRHTIQRDYGVYMDELAEMIGCQVTLGDYWQDPKLLRCLITGPMAAYQYRFVLRRNIAWITIL